MTSLKNDSGKEREIVWEQAFLRYETAEQEIRKFKRRFQKLGMEHWDRKQKIVEVFCGRGNGLISLAELGFVNSVGVDLSFGLLREHKDSFPLVQADCRYLPFPDGVVDLFIVQGGLHHLLQIPEDLDLVLAELSRVLKPGRQVFVVEPWDTAFLRFVHWAGQFKVFKSLYPKLATYAELVENEFETYYSWLGKKQEIIACFERYFVAEKKDIRWGKFIARYRRPTAAK